MHRQKYMLPENLQEVISSKHFLIGTALILKRDHAKHSIYYNILFYSQNTNAGSWDDSFMYQGKYQFL